MSIFVKSAGDVQVYPGWLRVTFADGATGDFHLRWLRHLCDRERHPVTRERLRCSSELPDVVTLRHASVRDGALEVRWAPDGHESRYDLDWLRAHAYALNRAAVPPPPSDLRAVELRPAGWSHGEVAADALARVRADGVAVVRRPGGVAASPEDETEALVEAFAAQGLAVIGTHFGRIEDLRTDNTTNENTDQLGYTDAAIGLHTDQPFLDAPPRYQLLQCIRRAEVGGENAVADGRAAFAHLASLDAHAAHLLRTVPVRFHRKQQRFERIVDGPLVTEVDGRFQVRLSYFTLSPLHLPFDAVEDYYRAHDRFVRLVRDPRHHYAIALDAGDWLLYDNHRMLHARAAFRGARWVRGVYFDEVAGR